MGKVGTAHIEIKPVLDEDALRVITDRIEAAVRAGVEAGMKSARAATVASTYIVGEAGPEILRRPRRPDAS